MDAILGRPQPSGPVPLASMIERNPVGTEQLRDQSFTNPDPDFQPGKMWGDKMVSGGFYDMAHNAMNNALGWVGQAGPAGRGIRAFHGSPHDFSQFDLAKIGTGEGAQAYGHGLYFAGNEGVAKSYKQSRGLSPQLDEINGRMSQLAKIMDKDAVPGAYRKYRSATGTDAAAEYDALMTKRADLGHMYEVNLGVEPGQLLDWDKPLSKQDALRGLVERTQAERAASEPKYRPLQLDDVKTDSQGNPLLSGSGGQAYQYLASKRYGATPEAVTEQLQQAGIPGIQYLDQGSRAAGEGSRNYVMFDPALVEIVRKYGLAGLLGGGAAAGAQAIPDEAPN